MKSFSFLLLLFFLTSVGLMAQTDTLDREAAPKHGINRLAAEYFGIEFSREQREYVDNKEIELILDIDVLGVPTLLEANGISRKDVIDSFYYKTEEIDLFIPALKEGKPVGSMYWIKFTFPRYGQETVNQYYLINGAREKDFESVELSRQSLEIVFGGIGTIYSGKIGDYLGGGGGMKLEMNYTLANKLFFGLGMNVSGNKRLKEFPVDNPRDQSSWPGIMHMGGILGSWVGPLAIQAELNYALMNIITRDDEYDDDYVQLTGFSPGIVAHYPIALSGGKSSFMYGSPMMSRNYLDLSLGARLINLNNVKAKGINIELGVSWRLRARDIKKFKFKEAYIESFY